MPFSIDADPSINLPDREPGNYKCFDCKRTSYTLVKFTKIAYVEKKGELKKEKINWKGCPTCRSTNYRKLKSDK